MRSAIAVASTFMLCTLSCQHAEDRYLERAVSVAEITGTWQMTPQTAKDIRDIGYAARIDPSQQEIVVLPDGTCHFNTVPVVLNERGQSTAPMNAECRWRLGKVGHQALQLELATKPPLHVYYYFGETPAGRLALWQHAGDPDMWRYVEYVKQ